MKRFLKILLFLPSFLFFLSCQACGRDLGDMEIIQKDADWDDVHIFCESGRALGLDPMSGERKILVRFPCIQLVPGSAVPGGGYAVFGWNTTGNPFDREAILVDEECRIVKKMECLQNAAYVEMINDDLFFSDSLCFSPEGTTAYAFTSISSGQIVYKDMTLPWLQANFHNYLYKNNFFIGVNGNDVKGWPSYILFRDIVNGTEEKEYVFTSSHPLSSFACVVFGDTLVLSFTHENIVEFWDIPTKSRIADYEVSKILPELGDMSEIVTNRAFQDGNTILVPVLNLRASEIHNIDVIAFSQDDCAWKGKIFSTKNPYYNHNSGFEYLSNGLLFLKGSTGNTSGVAVFDAKTGALVNDVAFE